MTQAGVPTVASLFGDIPVKGLAVLRTGKAVGLEMRAAVIRSLQGHLAQHYCEASKSHALRLRRSPTLHQGHPRPAHGVRPAPGTGPIPYQRMG